MKMQRYWMMVALAAVVGLMTPPAWGVSKEIVQLQTQVQALQDQMARMQQTFDERMGVMKNLVEQSTDNMNKVGASLDELRGNLQKQQGDAGTHTDQISGQIQALNDTLDELKARLAKVSKQLEDMSANQQNLTAQQTQQPQAPPPDVLYNNALRDYNAGKNDLAVQEFGDYIKFYPNTDLTGNSYFYLADIEYRQGNFAQAAKDYDQVMQNFPSGNKAPAAQLKKGLSLIELGQKQEGAAELRHVIQRYPQSNEAVQARDRLRKLGMPTTARKVVEN